MLFNFFFVLLLVQEVFLSWFGVLGFLFYYFKDWLLEFSFQRIGGKAVSFWVFRAGKSKVIEGGGFLGESCWFIFPLLEKTCACFESVDSHRFGSWGRGWGCQHQSGDGTRLDLCRSVPRDRKIARVFGLLKIWGPSHRLKKKSRPQFFGKANSTFPATSSSSLVNPRKGLFVWLNSQEEPWNSLFWATLRPTRTLQRLLLAWFYHVLPPKGWVLFGVCFLFYGL